jgi:hypothetical protein
MDTTTATATTTETAVTIMAKGADLARILNNATLAADNGRNALPVLASVRLELDGDTLTAVATDRYRLHFDTAACKAPQADTKAGALIRATDAATVAKMTKGAAEVFVTFGSGSVNVQTANGSATLTHVEGEFPKWRGLLPDPAAPCELAGVFGLNPQNLAPLAKVDTGESGKPRTMRVKATSPTRVFRIEIGETFVALIQPVRIPAA